MLPQFEHKVLSSFSLFVDHRILQSGQAFFAATGQFYPARTQQYNGRYAYNCPYKQLVNDTSINGANVLTGVYLNGNYITPGTSGLLSITHSEGSIDFSSPLAPTDVVTGNFSVKEVNVFMTTDSDNSIIFESKFFKNSQFPQTLSGLESNAYPYPAIFLKKRSSSITPFAIGGYDLTTLHVRALMISDNPYLSDAVASILKDSHMRRFGIITPPFDFRGRFTGASCIYNYTGIVGGETSPSGSLIQDVNESTVFADRYFKEITQKNTISFIDFDISHVRTH